MFCEPDRCPLHCRLPSYHPALFTAVVACHRQQPSPIITLHFHNGSSNFRLELNSSPQLHALLTLLTQVNHYLQKHLDPTIPSGGPERNSLHTISTQAP